MYGCQLLGDRAMGGAPIHNVGGLWDTDGDASVFFMTTALFLTRYEII